MTVAPGRGDVIQPTVACRLRRTNSESLTVIQSDGSSVATGCSSDGGGATVTAAGGGVALGVVMPGLVRGAGEDSGVFCSPRPLSGIVVSLSADAVETGW